MKRLYRVLGGLYFRATRQLMCKQAVALMSDYVDGVLDDRQAARLERHLGECPHCVEYLTQLRMTIDALGEVGPGDLSAEALDELVGLYREWRADPV